MIYTLVSKIIASKNFKTAASKHPGNSVPQRYNKILSSSAPAPALTPATTPSLISVKSQKKTQFIKRSNLKKNSIHNSEKRSRA